MSDLLTSPEQGRQSQEMNVSVAEKGVKALKNLVGALNKIPQEKQRDALENTFQK